MEYLRKNMMMNVDILTWNYKIIESIECKYEDIEKTIIGKGYKFIELIEPNSVICSITQIGAKVQ